MKKTVIWVLAVLLAGCGKPAVPSDEWKPLTGDVPVRFATHLGELDTKVTALGFEEGEQIGVFGFYHNGSGDTDGSWAAETAAGTNIPDYMFDQQVTLGSGVWEYTPIKYWPNENGTGSRHIDKLSFWGYYPHGGAGISFRQSGSGSAYTNATPGVPDVYLVASGFTDLMTSDLETDLYKGDAANHGNISGGEVELDFHHRLSQITVQAQRPAGEETPVKIHRLELRDVLSEGTYSSSWSLEAADDDYTVVSSVDGTAIANAPTPTLLNVLYLLPQDLVADGQKLYIEYSINDDPGHVVEEFDLLDTGTAEWVINHHYVYTLTITPTGIDLELTLELQPWEYHSFVYSGAVVPHIAWSGTRLDVAKSTGEVKLDSWSPAHCSFSFGTGSEWMATLVGDGDFTFCLADGTALVDHHPLPDNPSETYDTWRTTMSGTLSYESDGTPVPATLHVRVTDHATLLTHEALLRFYLRSREGDWQLVRMTTTAEGWGATVFESKLIQNYK